MGSFSAKMTTAAGTTTLPACALVGSAAIKIRVLEVGIFNTTATAVSLQFCRLSTAGTPGASATSRLLDGTGFQAAVGVLKNTYTGTAPTTTDLGIVFDLGAAIASAVVFTFDDEELIIPGVANAAVGLMADSGAGQAIRTYWKWRES